MKNRDEQKRCEITVYNILKENVVFVNGVIYRIKIKKLALWEEIINTIDAYAQQVEWLRNIVRELQEHMDGLVHNYGKEKDY